MEHITQSHTQDNGTNTQRQQRELTTNEIHHRQSEECTKKYGQQQQRQGIPVAETDHDKQQYQDQ